jgi:hypothetical protein
MRRSSEVEELTEPSCLLAIRLHLVEPYLAAPTALLAQEAKREEGD